MSGATEGYRRYPPINNDDELFLTEKGPSSKIDDDVGTTGGSSLISYGLLFI